MVMEDQKQYDNTNTGVGFKPFEDQKLILQGKFDVDGTIKNLAYHTAVSKDGSKRIDVYEKIGALFPNDKGDNELRPDYTGVMTCTNSVEKRLASWKRTNDNGLNYMTLEASTPKGKEGDEVSVTKDAVTTTETKVDDLDGDEIPF